MPTVNPVLGRLPDGQLIPHLEGHERLILWRKGVVLESNIPNVGKLSASGVLHVTDQRLFFIAETKKSRPDLGSLEVSFSDLCTAPDFEQPIFGANYLSLKSHDSSTTKLKFYEGGCNTLVPSVFALYQDSMKRNTPKQFSNINFGQGSYAFADPSDPTVFYISQPQGAVPILK